MYQAIIQKAETQTDPKEILPGTESEGGSDMRGKGPIYCWQKQIGGFLTESRVNWPRESGLP